MQPDSISGADAQEDAVKDAEGQGTQGYEVVATDVLGNVDAGVAADGDEDGGDGWGDDSGGDDAGSVGGDVVGHW